MVLAISEAKGENAAFSAAFMDGNYRSEANAFIDERADVAAFDDLVVLAETRIPNQLDFSTIVDTFTPNSVWEVVESLFNVAFNLEIQGYGRQTGLRGVTLEFRKSTDDKWQVTNYRHYDWLSSGK